METFLGTDISGLGSIGAFGQGSGSILYPGQQLSPGQSIQSDNGVFTFGMGGDGNLWVSDNARGIVLYNFNIAGRGAVKAIMQGDGNFVVYDAKNGVIWNSGAKGAGAYIVIQTDGNLVIYLNGVAKWSLGTNQSPSLVASEVQAIANRNFTNTYHISPTALPSGSATPTGDPKNMFPQIANGSIPVVQPANLTKNNMTSVESISMSNNMIYVVLKDITNNKMYALYMDNTTALGWLFLVAFGKSVQAAAVVATTNDTLLTTASTLISLINRLMTQKGSNASMHLWATPQLINDNGVGWMTVQDTQKRIATAINAYIAKINSADLSSMAISQKKDILHNLMYPYIYFANQAINLSPFRQAGHSNANNWGACQVNMSNALAILTQILPTIQKLGFTNLYNKLNSSVLDFWGRWGVKYSTGGHYPDELGFRKFVDETYRGQSDAKSANDDVFSQVGTFFAKAGTTFWHGVALPTFGVAILTLMTSGAMGLTFLIDLFAGTHLTQQIFAFTAKLFSGIPFIGKFISDLIKMLGDWLDHWAQEIRKIFSPDVNPNKARDEEEYNQLINSRDNEIINFEKKAVILTKILHDWDSDKRDDLKNGLIKNINSRPSASVIWASLNVIDKQLLGAA